MEFDHDLFGRIKINNRNLAIVDILGTLVGAYIYSRYFKVPIIISAPTFFIVGTATHDFLNIKTQI